MEPFTTVVISILSAFVSAIIATKLSLIRFRSEKWWEKKYEVYYNVIESLYNAHLYSFKHLEASFQENDISEEEKIRLGKEARNAQSNIERMKFLGAFFLSQKATACLSEYINKSYHIKEDLSWFEYLEYDSEITNKCFNDFVEIAKSDLSIESNTTFSKHYQLIQRKGKN